MSTSAITTALNLLRAIAPAAPTHSDEARIHLTIKQAELEIQAQTSSEPRKARQVATWPKE